ncbi:hypothetical protein CDEST_14395 [Colletotrichum destructivum]|uniref:Uncharacterized protein n=1 Tax=Colletotrichum destructivum TaxID=34406 RepID=A0AAX4J1K7_9PEZI|nr:hypothetical protein CDEST_14395 [Colletotrichum destructivum]
MANCVQFHTGCAWLGPCRDRNDQCIGIVYVPVSFLKFQRDLCREPDPAITSHLASVLQQDYDHDTCHNAIEGYIEHTEVVDVTKKLEMSVGKLQETIFNGQRPVLRHPISCVNGQHRTLAARAVFGDDAVWTVRLLCRPGVELSTVLQDITTSQTLDIRSHQTRYSDGEVFRKICQSWKEGKMGQAREWTERLGNQKKVNLRMIRENQRIHNCLVDLIPFPGLLHSLPLGSFHKHLALHCDEEIVLYLQHVRTVWLELTCNHPAIVDIATVQLLQGRAPGLSNSDRVLIEDAFHNDEIFTRVQDPQLRAEVRDSVFRFRGLVPSLKSFQENMKYLSIGVSIVLDLMFAGLARGKIWKNENHRWTLQQVLRRSWSPPPQNPMEVSEGHFLQYTGLLSFETAYIQVVLAALRNFPHLSNQYRPRIDPAGDEILPAADPARISMFYDRAHLLGFQIPAKTSSGDSCSVKHLEPGSQAPRELPLNYRWGVPYSSTFREAQDIMFLPRLANAVSGEEVSVQVVQQDLISSFFGVLGECRQTSTGTVTIPHQNTASQDVNMDQGSSGQDPSTRPRASTTVSLRDVGAQYLVNYVQLPSVLSQSATVHSSVDHWLESFQNTSEADHQTWSQSRSGIETPSYSWSGGLDDRGEIFHSHSTTRSRSPTGASYLAMSSPVISASSRSAISASGIPARRALQSLNVTPHAAQDTSLTSQPSLASRSAIEYNRNSPTDPTPASFPEIPPAHLWMKEQAGIASLPSSSLFSRSEIGEGQKPWSNDPSQAQNGWFFRRLPPLKSYFPSLQWGSQAPADREPVRLDTSHKATSPYSSVPLTPESGHSRSGIGTPIVYQHERLLTSQREGGAPLRPDSNYWDIV